MKTENVPEKYKHSLARARYEAGRTISNTAFMINMHINDDNADFLNSEIVKDLHDECIDALLNSMSVNLGIKLLMGYNDDTHCDIQVIPNSVDQFIINSF